MFNDIESQLDGIREIFADAQREDNWKTDELMLYSYYFVDKDVDKLEKLGHKLDANGYDFVDIFELGDEETGKSTGEYLLHIDKIETHTPESLARRNLEFQTLAEEVGIETYDGWEFGQIGDDEEDEEEE
ncbi:MAG: ribonuclease E inhibitor RraB [Blastocatellia bacterium]|nr:ribonuclease E inhibitor RraB [Blastocatellia bacterium]